MLICAILVLTKILIRFDQIYQKRQVQEFLFTLHIGYIIYPYISILKLSYLYVLEGRNLFVCSSLNANIRFVWKACSCLLNLSKIYISLSTQNLWFAILCWQNLGNFFCSIRRNLKSRFLSHVFRFSKFILGH